MSSTKLNHRGRILSASVVTALGAFIVCYTVFRWALINYWEWRTGHKMVFTFWAEDRAIPLALLSAGIAFWAVLVLLAHHRRNAERR